MCQPGISMFSMNRFIHMYIHFIDGCGTVRYKNRICCHRSLGYMPDESFIVFLPKPFVRSPTVLFWYLFWQSFDALFENRDNLMTLRLPYQCVSVIKDRCVSVLVVTDVHKAELHWTVYHHHIYSEAEKCSVQNPVVVMPIRMRTMLSCYFFNSHISSSLCYHDKEQF